MKNKQFYAVAGFPVSHSKSPLIFNSLFTSMDIEAWYSRISARSGSEAFEIFKTLGIRGLNITTPLKSELLPFCDQTDEAAGRIGGINTLLNDSGIIRGFNTDHLGVAGSLNNEDIIVKGKKCLVLGAGMTGRAAVYALLRMGGEVTIMNRTFKKAHILAGDMNCNSVVFEKLQSELADSDILISAISSGAEIIKESWLKEDLVVFDANYFRSHLSENAMSAGSRMIRGEKWLLNQAIPSFKIFTGQNIIKKEIEKISGSLERPEPPVSDLIFAGDKNIIKDLKSMIHEGIKNIEITTLSGHSEFESEKTMTHSGKKPFRILIYSEANDLEKAYFPFADLVVWGKGGIKDCGNRIFRELGNVL